MMEVRDSMKNNGDRADPGSGRAEAVTILTTSEPSAISTAGYALPCHVAAKAARRASDTGTKLRSTSARRDGWCPDAKRFEQMLRASEALADGAGSRSSESVGGRSGQFLLGRACCRRRGGRNRCHDNGGAVATSDHRTGAAMAMNSAASSIIRDASASKAARWIGSSTVRAVSSSGSASATQIATEPQRNWRKNQAGEPDGATRSSQARSAPARVSTRSTPTRGAPTANNR